MDAAPPIAGWNVVTEALARLREDNQRFEQFCEEQLDDLEAQRAEWEQEQQAADQRRTDLEHELDQARSQMARLASVAVELADARRELVRVKEDLLGQREIAAEAGRRATSLEKQVAQQRRELAALEADLAESHDRAESDKRRISEQRAEWVGDLLRSALDLQSQPKDADLKLVHDEPETPAEAEAVSRVDPVLGAVMQQFEALQKGRGKGRQGVA